MCHFLSAYFEKFKPIEKLKLFICDILKEKKQDPKYTMSNRHCSCYDKNVMGHKGILRVVRILVDSNPSKELPRRHEVYLFLISSAGWRQNPSSEQKPGKTKQSILIIFCKQNNAEKIKYHFNMVMCIAL